CLAATCFMDEEERQIANQVIHLQRNLRQFFNRNTPQRRRKIGFIAYTKNSFLGRCLKLNNKGEIINRIFFDYLDMKNKGGENKIKLFEIKREEFKILIKGMEIMNLFKFSVQQFRIFLTQLIKETSQKISEGNDVFYLNKRCIRKESKMKFKVSLKRNTTQFEKNEREKKKDFKSREKGLGVHRLKKKRKRGKSKIVLEESLKNEVKELKQINTKIVKVFGKTSFTYYKKLFLMKEKRRKELIEDKSSSAVLLFEEHDPQKEEIFSLFGPKLSRERKKVLISQINTLEDLLLKEYQSEQSFEKYFEILIKFNYAVHSFKKKLISINKVIDSDDI
ncbi:MAG: hypothetical protein MJ252_26855, partial [archaeon]|nr:hypothetical protein [archaeon]